MPLLSEVGGIVRYGDLIEGVTIQEELDEVTGLSRKVVIESRDPEARPRQMITGASGKSMQLPNNAAPATYTLPVRANIVIQDMQPWRRSPSHNFPPTFALREKAAHVPCAHSARPHRGCSKRVGGEA
jgi:hypothetical protein